MPSGRSVPTRLRTQGRHARHSCLSGICVYVLFHRPNYESLFKRRLPQPKPVSRTNRGERGCFSSRLPLTRFSRGENYRRHWRIRPITVQSTTGNARVSQHGTAGPHDTRLPRTHFPDTTARQLGPHQPRGNRGDEPESQTDPNLSNASALGCDYLAAVQSIRLLSILLYELNLRFRAHQSPPTPRSISVSCCLSLVAFRCTRYLMLIRLFQQTARSSVAECLVHRFPGLFASFSFSSPAKRPARSTWPRAAGPRATSAPDARTIAVTRWWDEDAGSAPPVVTKCP